MQDQNSVKHSQGLSNGGWQLGRRRRRSQRPCQEGLRLSQNALTPSRKSALP